MPDPNKIEGGRWDSLLRKIFNLKGAGATSARISDDISPTFNFPFREEDEFLLNEKLFWAPARSSASANFNPRCIITNTSENTLLIINRVTFAVSGGGIPYFGASTGPVPFLAAVPVYSRDSRITGLDTDVGFGNARVQEQEIIPAPTPIMLRLLSTPEFQSLDLGLILGPADSLFFTNATVNTLTQCTFFWREHLMEPGEFA